MPLRLITFNFRFLAPKTHWNGVLGLQKQTSTQRFMRKWFMKEFLRAEAGEGVWEAKQRKADFRGSLNLILRACLGYKQGRVPPPSRQGARLSHLYTCQSPAMCHTGPPGASGFLCYGWRCSPRSPRVVLWRDTPVWAVRSEDCRASAGGACPAGVTIQGPGWRAGSTCPFRVLCVLRACGG